jgi:hypothetical protein
LPAFFAASNASIAPPGARNPVDVLTGLDGVSLPEVEMVGLQETEGGLQLLLRFLRCALDGLGGEEDVLPDALQADAVGFFGTPVPVETRAVEVVHAELIDLADVRCRRLNVRKQVHAGSALRDDAHLDAGLAERRRGNVPRLHSRGRRVGAADGHAGHCAAHERSSLHGLSPFLHRPVIRMLY